MSGRFPRTSRVRRPDEYQRLRRLGRQHGSRHFVIQTLTQDAGPPKLGLIVSRKVGGAVVRNQLKRRLREFFRSHQHRLRPGFCLAISARSSAAGLSYSCLSLELEQLLVDYWLPGS